MPPRASTIKEKIREELKRQRMTKAAPAGETINRGSAFHFSVSVRKPEYGSSKESSRLTEKEPIRR